MSSNFYTTKTAALKATKADIRNFNAQEIKLKDKNILDYIKESEFDSYDTRDHQLKNDELDIWNTAISLSDNGHIEVKPLEHSVMFEQEQGFICEGITENQHNTLKTAAKVIDREVLGSDDEHIMYWQTDGLTNSMGMFLECSNLTSFSSDLSSLTNGYGMFLLCENLTTFSSDLSNLVNGEGMFAKCTALISFTSDLSSLTNSNGMFGNCTNLTSFAADLSNMTDGEQMFMNCTNLTSFTSDLSNLTNGEFMFDDCTKLTSFTSDLSNLTNGWCMFQSCKNLTSFTSDLSSLSNGNSMFANCKNLTSFTSDLSNLTDGTSMFYGCKFDAHSVANIVHTLPTHESTGEITIGLGCYTSEADRLLFAQECDCVTWQELLDEFSAKNWTVEFQYNGRPTTTYNMRRGETLPVYTKLEEVIMPTDEKEVIMSIVEKEHKSHYDYTSADGSKFYNIRYFHSTNGSTEGYDVFSSLEEAISTYNVTPKN